MKTKIQFIFGFSILSAFFFSCGYEQPDIPAVPVDISLNLSDPQFYELKSAGNFVYITGGVSGIIVYRKSFDEFIAYERLCPHDPDCGRVFVDEDVFFAEDTVCCASQFSLDVDGAVVSGPSKFPLRMYQAVFYSNQNVLKIQN
jgi:nitrite reductase/ring-hydroxylating ferredoxin subunit